MANPEYGAKDEREVEVSAAWKAPAWLGGPDFSLRFRRLWEGRGAELTKTAAQIAGVPPDAIAERVQADEVFADIFLQAGEKAVRTGDEDFRRALAALVATAYRDEAKVDVAAYALGVVTQLSPADLRVLTVLEGTRLDPISTHQVRERIWADRGVVDAALARLNGLGLLGDPSRPMTYEELVEDLAYWQLSELGRLVLEVCAELMPEEDEVSVADPLTQPGVPRER